MEGESAFGYLSAFRLGKAGSPLPAERFADGAHKSDAPYPKHLSLLRFFHHAQLLKHSKHIPIYPALDDLAVCDAIDRHAAPTGSPPCGGNAHDLGPVRAAGNELSRDQISFRDLCYNAILEIGKRLMKSGNKLFPSR